MHAYIEDIAKHDGQPVTIKGWLAGRRSSGKIHFLQIRDGSGFIQAVMSKAAVGDETFARADHLAQESAVIVHGTARADKRAPGGYEIDATGLDVIGEAHDYPITPKEHGVDFLIDHRHLWMRSARQHAILRVRDEVDRRGARLLPRARLRPVRRADPHAVRLRRHDDALRDRLLRRREGVPHAERPALRRGRRAGVRQGLLLRADLPRREVEDAPSPDGVLDGRAGGRVTRRSTTSCELAEDFVASSSAACSSDAREELDGPRARHDEARRSCTTPFPRITYDEAIDALKEKGLPVAMGRRPRRRRGTALSADFDGPVDR